MSIIDSSYSTPLIVSFNSMDRTAGSNNNFVSNPVDIGINKYNAVCLVQASIPKSWYNLPSGYNSFTLREIAVNTTITIPPGNYTKISLSLKLSTLLTTASTLLGNNWVYTVSYPDYTEPDDFKFTFTVTGNGLNQPSLIFTTLSPYRQMGFDVGTYTFVGGTLQSVYAMNLNSVLRLFILSNIVSESYNSILEEILSVGNFPPQGIVYFQQYNFDGNSKALSLNNNNSWNFSLVDSLGRAVDLNGVHWAFTLVFFQRSITHELHKQDLIIKNEERLFEIQQKQEQLKKELEIENENIIKPKAGLFLEEFL